MGGCKHRLLAQAWLGTHCLLSAAAGTEKYQVGAGGARPWHGSTAGYTPSFGGTVFLEGSLCGKGAVVIQTTNV